VVSVGSKKVIVRALSEAGKASISKLCEVLSLQRSTFYQVSQRSEENVAEERRIVELSESKPRYGYRRVTSVLNRSESEPVNVKRVQAVRRKHGLQVRKKQRKMKRAQTNEQTRLRATHPNQVWSWDFVQDQTVNGGSFRCLSVIDEYTRQCHSLTPRRSYRATNVIETLEQLVAIHGAPEYIRSDNGPEFIAYAIQDWMKERGIKSHYIKPGSPWEQAYVESFHDKFRDEFLNRELFFSLREAEMLIEGWRNEYNQLRPPSSLGYQTPDEFAACTPASAPVYDLRSSLSATKSDRQSPNNQPNRLQLNTLL